MTNGEQAESGQGGPAIVKVATTTFANGGDNIGVYVPVFTNFGTSGTIVYCVVFLVLVGVWCAAGRFVATRPVIAKPLGRWGHILLPVVLITIGLLIPSSGDGLTVGGMPDGVHRVGRMPRAARPPMPSRSVADTLVSSLSLDIRCTPDYTLMQ